MIDSKREFKICAAEKLLLSKILFKEEVLRLVLMFSFHLYCVVY